MGGTRERPSIRELPWRRRAFLLLIAALLALGFLPSGFFAISPGPTFSLSGMASVRGRPDPTTSFHMVTVTANEANWYTALLAAADPRVALWDRAGVFGGKSLDQYSAEMKGLMEESRVQATRQAFRAAGMPPTDEAVSMVSVENGEVLGPSAGLAFALQISSILMDEDLSAGIKVAATGALDDSGRVLAIGGIAQKAMSCRDNGIQLFLVPTSNYEEALKHAGNVRVVGVASLDEAIEVMRGVTRSIP